MRTPRYSALSFLSAVVRVCGYIVLFFSFILAAHEGVVLASTNSLAHAFVYALAVLLKWLVGGVVLIAAADCMIALMDIEENTRKAADVLTGTRTMETPRQDTTPRADSTFRRK